MRTPPKVSVALAAVALLGVWAAPAQADISATFEMVFFENEHDAPTAGLLYTVQVSDTDRFGDPLELGPGGENQARFRIANESTAFDSVLTAVYFDDGVLLGIQEVWCPPEDPFTTVYFEQDLYEPAGGVSPHDLPGGENIAFATSDMDGALFAADAENPGTHWGLSNGEYFDITFLLSLAEEPGEEDGTVEDVIAMMSGDLDDDGLLDIRVGAHIQQLGESGEWSGSVVTIPAPGAMLLGAVGLGLVVWVKRRFG